MSHIPTVIVTGAAHGIGRAVAERLGSTGARVVVNYRSDAEAAESVVTAIRAAGGEATAAHADVAVPEQVNRVFDVARESYGDPHVVVHCAAVTHFAPLAQATDADYDRVFDANTRAAFATLRAAAGRVVDEGRIIVISSGAAAVPRANAGLYAASKAAGDQLVRVLATELADRRITVNSVRPGPTRTEKVAAMPPEKLAAVAAEIPFRQARRALRHRRCGRLSGLRRRSLDHRPGPARRWRDVLSRACVVLRALVGAVVQPAQQRHRGFVGHHKEDNRPRHTTGATALTVVAPAGLVNGTQGQVGLRSMMAATSAYPG
ncbi:SDR family NAD(P)-dependent oxidoreductase [Solihabitans fulvus]|uniref:SDR family NAD(P)-dependent oxidoreductase n=1 Tax=Solihabitans fulvus TaxID=1892852 RepID=UPI003F66890A